MPVDNGHNLMPVIMRRRWNNIPALLAFSKLNKAKVLVNVTAELTGQMHFFMKGV